MSKEEPSQISPVLPEQAFYNLEGYLYMCTMYASLYN